MAGVLPPSTQHGSHPYLSEQKWTEEFVRQASGLVIVCGTWPLGLMPAKGSALRQLAVPMASSLGRPSCTDDEELKLTNFLHTLSALIPDRGRTKQTNGK